MTVELSNPEGHVEVPIYHHVAVASGARQVFLAGQVAWDERGELVGRGDLAQQVAQVVRNVEKSLRSVGGSLTDVARVTWYAAGWRREMYPAFEEGLRIAHEEFVFDWPPLALIGVEILFEEGILIEAEVTAVLDVDAPVTDG